jgi:hypothetical protein
MEPVRQRGRAVHRGFHRHGAQRAQRGQEQLLLAGRRVLRQDEGDAAAGGQGAQERAQGLQAAGGRAEAHDQMTRAPRAWRGRRPRD